MDETVGCKIFQHEEVDLVADNQVGFLRVRPNRKRKMPILVPVPPDLHAAAATLAKRDQQNSNQREWLREHKDRLAAQEVSLRESAVRLQAAEDMVRGRENQIRNQKEQLIKKEERLARQEALLLEKDAAIASQLASIQELGAMLIARTEEKDHARTMARRFFNRAQTLRDAVTAKLLIRDTDTTWMTIHTALKHALIGAGYLSSWDLSWWHWRRWFRSQDVLPDAFFVNPDEISIRDIEPRRMAAIRVIQQLRGDLQPALDAMSFSVEESQFLAPEPGA